MRLTVPLCRKLKTHYAHVCKLLNTFSEGCLKLKPNTFSGLELKLRLILLNRHPRESQTTKGSSTAHSAAGGEEPDAAEGDVRDGGRGGVQRLRQEQCHCHHDLR